MKQLLILLFISAISVLHGQAVHKDTLPKQVTLVHYINHNKIKHIKPGKYVEVVIKTGEDSTLEYSGTIGIGDSTHILLQHYKKQVFSVYNTGQLREQSTIYYMGNTSIPVSNIKYVATEQRAVPLCAALGGAGLASVVLLAPLSSYNFHHNEFNSRRYFRIAYPSAIAAVAGFTLSYVFEERRFKVKM